MNQRPGAVSIPGGTPHEPPGADAPAHYEFQIEGHLDEYWSAWFGGWALIREDDGTTTLRGAVIDQAELYGLLAKVRDLGTTLISVKTIDAPGRTDKEAISLLPATKPKISGSSRRGWSECPTRGSSGWRAAGCGSDVP